MKRGIIMVFEGIVFEAIYHALSQQQMGWSAKTKVQKMAHVVLPDCLNGLPVLEIGPYLFANDDTLETIQLPSTILTIGFRAFMECEKLHTVTIYQSDKGSCDTLALYGNAFKNCANLSKFNGEKLIKFLGTGVFGKCTNLNFSADIHILGDIPTATFHMCHELNDISILGETVHISPTAFHGCKKLKRVYLDCDGLEFESKGLSVLKDKQFVCLNDCKAIELAYLGLNVTT